MNHAIHEVFVNDSESQISVYVLCNKCFIASAEISKIENDTWYFNRLIVPQNFRNQGFATKLLTKLKNVLDEKRINLICDINPYGDLNYEQLHKLYAKFGFTDEEEHMIYRGAIQ